MENPFSFLGALSFADCRKAGRGVLLAVREAYEAQSLVYVCPSGHEEASAAPCLIHTFGPEWEEALPAQARAAFCALARLGLRRMAPLDCSALPPLTEGGARYAEAMEPFGLGPRGLLFPLHGPAGKSAVLLVATERGEREWEQYKRDSLAGLQTIAVHFHESMALMHDAAACVFPVRLSGRELECLQWCARGKSYWETAVILGISERTVNHHMKMAREKLEVLTNAQAVSRAHELGLIAPGGWRGELREPRLRRGRAGGK